MTQQGGAFSPGVFEDWMDSITDKKALNFFNIYYFKWLAWLFFLTITSKSIFHSILISICRDTEERIEMVRKLLHKNKTMEGGIIPYNVHCLWPLFAFCDFPPPRVAALGKVAVEVSFLSLSSCFNICFLN